MDKRCAKESLNINGQAQYGEWLKAGSRVREKGFEKGKAKEGNPRGEQHTWGSSEQNEQGGYNMDRSPPERNVPLVKGEGKEGQSVRKGEDVLEEERGVLMGVGGGEEGSFGSKGLGAGLGAGMQKGGEGDTELLNTPSRGGISEIGQLGSGEVEGDIWNKGHVEGEVGRGGKYDALAFNSLHEIQLVQVEGIGSGPNEIAEIVAKGKARKKIKGRLPLRELDGNRVLSIRDPKRKFQLIDEEMVDGEDVNFRGEVCKKVKIPRDTDQIMVEGANLDWLPGSS